MTAQAASDGEAFRYWGSCPTIGITSVCISETTIPPSASTGTTAPVLGGAAVPVGADCSGASDMRQVSGRVSST
ncbi:hypothetical protein GCM10010233_48440 [Streptomyces pseudogriseolus]|uniref:Uncharacterized protein n=1 Tax=Streptomyces pseudogriseolus TaxID=36817 RepID=A0ABQ2T1U2_STREZ|nr:hypothetical protein GCM10010233_48440 [Streptomyces gancidicus]GGS48351.1 hypothetical protein GCM10010285_29750 [Streptomyces rubiginosus]